MSASIVNLTAESRAPADKLSYGSTDWVAIHSATAGVLSCGPAAAAGSGTGSTPGPAAQHYCARVTLSYSAAPAVSVLTIKDGATIIHQEEISADTRRVDLDFSKRPLRATIGAALTANVGSAGGAVVQTLIMHGFSVNQGAQTSV